MIMLRIPKEHNSKRSQIQDGQANPIKLLSGVQNIGGVERETEDDAFPSTEEREIAKASNIVDMAAIPKLKKQHKQKPGKIRRPGLT